MTTNPWRGDLVTAAYSTGIPTIDAYTALPRPVRALMRIAPAMPALVGSSPWQAVVKALIGRLPVGPTDQQLAAGSSHVWARVSTSDGRQVESILHGPEAYEFTARAALLLLRRVLAKDTIAGFQTPATAYGPDFVLEVEGVRRDDVRMS